METLEFVTKDGKKYIPYPMLDDYAGDWSQWDIAREIISNARDAGDYTIDLNNNTLVISDNGSKLPAGIMPIHLLLGKSQKNDDNAIGQFGEGMKLAMRLGLELNMPITIESVSWVFSADEVNMLGEKTMRIFYTEKPASNHPGTIVKIQNWNSDLDISGMFLQDDFSDCIYYNGAGSVLPSHNNPSLYVKKVYVKSNPDFCFSYDLPNVKMVKGRSTISIEDIVNGIKTIMSYCENQDLWEAWLNICSSDNPYNEKNIRLNYLSGGARAALRDAYNKVYPNHVIGTNYRSIKSCEHIKVKTIEHDKLGGLVDVLHNFCNIPTDSEAYAQEMGRDYILISSHKINEEQKSNLGYLRKICKRLDFDVKKLKISSRDSDNQFAGLCDYQNDIIILNEDTLNRLSYAVGVLIHEIAHYQTHAEDLTDRHVTKIEELSGRIIAGYMRHDL